MAKKVRTAGDPLGVESFHLSNRLLFRLFKTTNRLHTAGTKWTADFNLTTQQWSVIGALARQGYDQGMGVGALSDFLQITRQNLAGLLQRLDKQGVTQRILDPNDGRARLVTLPDQGWEVWEELVKDIARFYERALDGFSPEEMIQLLFFMDKLQANLHDMSSEPERGKPQVT